MKAEEYIPEWCDKTYKGGKELGDWTTKEVMKFANDFAKKQLQLGGVVGRSEQLKAFVKWKNEKDNNWLKFIDEKDVDNYLQSL